LALDRLAAQDIHATTVPGPLRGRERRLARASDGERRHKVTLGGSFKERARDRGDVEEGHIVPQNVTSPAARGRAAPVMGREAVLARLML